MEITIPEIQPKIQPTKSKGAIGGIKIAATWKGENRSKHAPEKLAKQNIKDAKWVIGSVKNIACSYGDHKDGELETKFSNLLEHLRNNPEVEGKDFTEGLEHVKKSTWANGCRHMARTRQTMDDHEKVCKFKPKTTLAPTPPTTETAECGSDGKASSYV